MFSDGVFAIVITILVLELRPPESPTFSDLLSLWPTGLSYAVSYMFLAIVWVNHHHVLRYAEAATPRLIWANFAHLFAISLIPFSMAWIANSRLCRGVCARERDLHRVLGGRGSTEHCRCVAARPAHDADTVVPDLGSICGGGRGSAQVPDGGPRTDLLLPDPLSEAGSSPGDCMNCKSLPEQIVK
jgi:hypothetical protein